MKKFLDLGLQPLANSYIKKDNLKSKEKKFKLVVGLIKKLSCIDFKHRT